MGCLSDGGYGIAEKARALALGALWAAKQKMVVDQAKDSADALIDNYKKEHRIANRSIKIAEEEQALLKDEYWPRELKFLKEFIDPQHGDSFARAYVRISGRLMSTVAGQFAKHLRAAKVEASRYATSYNVKLLQDVQLSKAQAMGNARILAFLVARNEIMQAETTDYKKKEQAIAIGDGLMQQVAQLYSSASRGLSAANETLSNQLSGALESLGFDIGGAIDRFREVRNANSNSPTRPVESPTRGQSPSMNFVEADAATRYSGMSEQLADWTRTMQHGLTDPASQYSYGDEGNFIAGQHEADNSGLIGQPDLARAGTIPFPVISISGGVVPVTMDFFPLQDVRAFPPTYPSP